MNVTVLSKQHDLQKILSLLSRKIPTTTYHKAITE